MRQNRHHYFRGDSPANVAAVCLDWKLVDWSLGDMGETPSAIIPKTRFSHKPSKKSFKIASTSPVILYFYDLQIS
jgi:hypothetical protein